MKTTIINFCSILSKATLAFTAVFSLMSCSDSESYSNLLKSEEKATNWYMAQRKICTEIPADSIFEIGPDAPYYKMDEDGYLYMQVISRGDTVRPGTGDKVLFRFMRCNIKNYYLNGVETWEGNADNMIYASASFHFNTYVYEDSQTYGQGIQIPMRYLGYNSEVNLVLRSYIGFSSDQSNCLPYALNVKYFKPEY